VLGISTDRVASQKRFVDRCGLSYPMLCDVGGKVAAAYGVRGRLGFAGRTSFLIDAAGLIRKVYEQVSPASHAEEVLGDLKLLE
jgi:peroxiredoxin Q/BCP